MRVCAQGATEGWSENAREDAGRDPDSLTRRPHCQEHSWPGNCQGPHFSSEERGSPARGTCAGVRDGRVVLEVLSMMEIRVADMPQLRCRLQWSLSGLQGLHIRSPAVVSLTTAPHPLPSKASVVCRKWWPSLHRSQCSHCPSPTYVNPPAPFAPRFRRY